MHTRRASVRGPARTVAAVLIALALTVTGPAAAAPAAKRAHPCKGLHGPAKKACKQANKKPKKPHPCKGLHGPAKKACKQANKKPKKPKKPKGG